jgi:hypothetical protein
VGDEDANGEPIAVSFLSDLIIHPIKITGSKRLRTLFFFFFYLNRVMSGELSTGLDLLNTLLAPLAPEAVDTSSLPLPPGGIAPMTHSSDHLSAQPEPITLINASVSLMRKRKAAQNASCLLKRTAGELAREAKRSQNEWDTLLKLREQGWNMRPKGAKPGADMSLMGKGAERAAKEIGIAYATTEGPFSHIFFFFLSP